MAELRGLRDYVVGLAFSHDGTFLVSGSGDRTIRIWDTVPAPDRDDQQREHRSLREQQRPYVKGLLKELGDAAAVATRLGEELPREDLRRMASLRVLRELRQR